MPRTLTGMNVWCFKNMYPPHGPACAFEGPATITQLTLQMTAPKTFEGADGAQVNYFLARVNLQFKPEWSHALENHLITVAVMDNEKKVKKPFFLLHNAHTSTFLNIRCIITRLRSITSKLR